MTASLALVVGARPNFMKAAPLLRGLARHPHVAPRLIHTGQHFDETMSDRFFADLSLPAPDVSLGISGGGHAEQVGRLLEALDAAFADLRPACVVVVGDVNSTLAGALAAAQRGIPVAHVEAGLRSGDRTMPEEINRIATDALAARLYTPTRAAGETLRREGHPADAIRFVGNVMIDSLVIAREHAARAPLPADVADAAHGAIVLTLHRPANVDDAPTLHALLDAIATAGAPRTVLFPVHPRTRAVLHATARALPPSIRTCEPLGYLAFLRLLQEARLVLTDSGGVQEETTVLGTPCLTLRDTTERPITVHEGTNTLVGTDPARVAQAVRAALDGERTRAARGAPELWDGHAGERIADDLAGFVTRHA